MPEEQKTVKNREKERLWAALSYFSILLFIPLLKKRKSDFVAYHVNQGLVLFILEFCIGVIFGVVALILAFAAPMAYLVLQVIYLLISLLFLVCHIIGFIHVIRRKKKKVPIFGSIQAYRPEQEAEKE